MLASMSGEGFSYLVMFDCDGEAAVLRHWLQRAWCSQNVSESDDAHAHPSGQEAGPWTLRFTGTIRSAQQCPSELDMMRACTEIKDHCKTSTVEALSRPSVCP
jgi:hypothetical protein